MRRRRLLRRIWMFQSGNYISLIKHPVTDLHSTVFLLSAEKMSCSTSSWNLGQTVTCYSQLCFEKGFSFLPQYNKTGIINMSVLCVFSVETSQLSFYTPLKCSFFYFTISANYRMLSTHFYCIQYSASHIWLIIHTLTPFLYMTSVWP